MPKQSEGQSLLGALGANYAKNLERRGRQEQAELEARRANAIDALTSQRAALLSSGARYDLRGKPVEQSVNEIDALISDIKAAQGKSLSETAPSMFQKIGRAVGTVAEQTLGGQALADVMTPSDASTGDYERNQFLAGLIPAVASAGSGIPGKVAGSVGKFGRTLKAAESSGSWAEAAQKAGQVAPKVPSVAPRVPGVKGTPAPAPSKALLGKLSKSERIAGAAQKSGARAGMTATNEELAAAAPFIDAAGGDFEAGIRAYKASMKGGKNVAIPSPSAAGSAPSPAPSPEMAGNQHVPPREASAASPAPAPAQPSSSTLSKLLKSAGLVGAGATAEAVLANLISGAQDQVAAEGAGVQPDVLMGRMPQVQNTISKANTVPETAPAAQPAQPANGLNEAILSLLTGGGQVPQETQPQAFLSDQDIAQIQKLVGVVAPQQPAEQPVQKKPSLTSQIFDAIGKGLIAGGTGDPNAAFAGEQNARQEALAQEQLLRSKQEFSPQQQFLNQILAQVLGNRMGVSGQKELLSAQTQAANQQQTRQLAAQVLMLEKEQQNALARNDVQYAQQLEMQKREAASRLQQIEAQTTGAMRMMLNPEVQKLLSGAMGMGGPTVNQ